MMPFFSIIIPVYNVAPYLRECLDSVLAQTFTDWEAICVDDGSTDGSGAILDEYASRDPRFRVIHQPNAGVSSARNAALDVAEGYWIGFLDADDVVEMDWLMMVADAIEPEIDWIRTGWTDCYIQDNKRVKCKSEVKGVSDVLKQNIMPVGWQLISACSFPFVNFYCRSLVKDIRFIEGIRFREDALFCFEISILSKGLKIIPVTGYLRRERMGRATFSYRRRDDTINLLVNYLALWKRRSLRISNLPKEVIKASTFWVHKDVCQWHDLCLEVTFADAFKVWKLVRKLLHIGVVSQNCGGTRFDVLRWKLYLLTGWGRLLLINRLNVFGKKQKIQE